MTVVVVMKCPDCGYSRKFPEGQDYTQEDLMCPNHPDTALVVESTYDEPDAGPLPEAPAPPPAEDVTPTTPQSAALRLEKIRAIARACNAAEAEYKQAQEDAVAAKKVLTKRLAELRKVIIEDAEAPTLPFDEAPRQEPEAEPEPEPSEDTPDEIEEIEEDEEEETPELTEAQLREHLKGLNVEIVEEEEPEPEPKS